MQRHVLPPSVRSSAVAAQAVPGAGAPAVAGPSGAVAQGASAAAAPAVPSKPRCTPPAWRYPAMARHLHEEGSALVDVTLGAQGQVRQASLHSSTGYDDLDSTALAAARNISCTGSASTLAGMHVLLPVTFHLH
ncbi:TonB family protein [Komagataeibacter rhaeticus]|uniref:TonB family protein n=1 Tax=Komagataeibacter rhaeticus TaxID=215221 RepID=UPI001F0AC8B3|nr:TonB family protein [Komagataeibacter rhaeticus]